VQSAQVLERESVGGHSVLEVLEELKSALGLVEPAVSMGHPQLHELPEFKVLGVVREHHRHLG